MAVVAANRRFGKTVCLQMFLAAKLEVEMENESVPVISMQIYADSSITRVLISSVAQMMSGAKFPDPKLELTQEEENNDCFIFDPKWDEWLEGCDNAKQERHLFTVKVFQHVKKHHTIP